MLAEPRFRRGYVLAPRGKPLYEDEDRFGTKLLQKMGWSKGKGLGRDETGTQDFLRVRYKNDAKGFGFVGRDDQWTQHEESFSGLLNTLNGEEENVNSNASQAKQVSRDESEDEAPRIGFGFQTTTVNDEVKSKNALKLKEKISGISLEEKSKQSRARVHYKKFTRGKDLSQYSEKDLANIFGRKEGEVTNKVNSQPEEDANQFGSESNVNFLQTGISVSDYFKMKMEAKRKGLQNGVFQPATTGDSAEYNGVTDQVQGEEISRKKRKNSSEDMDDAEVLKKKKKKSKKNKSQDSKSEDIVETECPSYINIDAIEGDIEDIEEKKPKKSKKKSKNKMEENTKQEEQAENETINSEIIESTEQKTKKNKKKSKNKSEVPVQQEAEELEQPQEGKTKRKKKKQQDTLDTVIEDSQSTVGTTIEIDMTDEPQKKKHKKSKKSEIESNNSNDNEETKANIEDLQTRTEKKKSKKKNKKQSTDDQEAASHTKSKDVSSNASSILTKNVNVQQLELDDIEKLHNSYNIYRISSFCAEKFRNVNLNDFKGSILPQIEGYGFSEDIQLDVQVNENDEERITNLWKCVLNKYIQLEQPKKTYKKYVKEVIKARKMKQKQPKLYVKTWKRKNAFQIV